MAHEILTAWLPLHTLNHKKQQRIKQKVFHQTKLEFFFQMLILHGLNFSCISVFVLVFVELSCSVLHWCLPLLGYPRLSLLADQYVPTRLSFGSRGLNGSGRAGRGPNVYSLCKTGYHMNDNAESARHSQMEIAYTHYKMSAYIFRR